MTYYIEPLKKLKYLLQRLAIVCSLICILFPSVSMNVKASSVTDLTNQETTQQETLETPSNAEKSDPTFGINITTSDSEGLAGTLQVVIILTLIALSPTILILMTAFTRILIVLHFTRAALGTQSAPPNQLLIGMALILTFFIMAPVMEKMNGQVLQPVMAGEIDQKEAFQAGGDILKKFMLDQMDEKDLSTIVDIGKYEVQSDPMNYTLTVVTASFILTELRKSFIMGFMIYIPFIVIDMVVASVLMSMGMMMLPPTTISLPFKILLFILADGWNLIIVNVMKTFIISS